MDSNINNVPGQSAHPAGVAQRQSNVVFRDDEGQAVRLPSPASAEVAHPIEHLSFRGQEVAWFKSRSPRRTRGSPIGSETLPAL